MNRLWIRFSLIIGGFFLLLILLPLGTIFILEQVNIVDIRENERLEQGEFSPRELPERLFVITAVVGLIGIGLGIWLSRGLSAPISDLAAAAQQIGTGDLSRRVPIPNHSQELIDLAQAFNKMAADLQQAEALRQTMLADVSHELRTPLTVLSGQLNAWLDQVYELEEEDIANLYDQTRHLVRLVEDLHLLAQAEAQQLSLNLSPIDLGVLWQEIAANFQPLTEEKKVTFTLFMAANLPKLRADPVRLRQIFTNLLMNALRHTPAGGTITVKGIHDPQTITITIEDTGEGIVLDHLPHLFDRFYRTDASRNRQTGGSGLGLAIVKALVERHQGHISVNSPGPGLGTTFRVDFLIENQSFK